MARRLPVGVVGVIAPFNVPIDPGASARSRRRWRSATRCCSSPTRAPRSAAARCSRAIFEEAGLPAGLLHVLPGGADVGEALVTEPVVRVVSFTGSTRAGRAVAALAAQHLKRVHLELGGNSALIVLDDVDPDAASRSARGVRSRTRDRCA